MNIPLLPMGLSQRDLEPQDPEAQYERELDEADQEIDLEREKPTEAEKQWEEWNLPAED